MYVCAGEAMANGGHKSIDQGASRVRRILRPSTYKHPSIECTVLVYWYSTHTGTACNTGYIYLVNDF
jgi:hypothetical protein